MNGIRNTYLYVCGSQRLLDIRRIYTSAGLKRLRYSCCGRFSLSSQRGIEHNHISLRRSGEHSFCIRHNGDRNSDPDTERRSSLLVLL